MPAEEGNGLAMRLGVSLEALSRTAEVDVVVLPVSGAADAPSPLLRRLGLEPQIVRVAGRADTQFALLSRLADPAARLTAFRAYGRGSRHAFLSPPVLDEVRHLAGKQDYALAHVERLYLFEAGLAARCPRLSVDLDEDDAWSWRRSALLARRHGEVEGAAWAEAEAAAEDRLLGQLSESGATTFIASRLDFRRLRRRHPSLSPLLVPNAVVVPGKGERRDDGRTLLFVGAFGYSPNVEGVLWFIEAIWPAIRDAEPAARLLVAGSGAPAALRAHAGRDGIDVLGFVADLEGLYARATLAIAPLRAGGGTRIKLLEAAAHGVPIVATPLAAQGLAFGGEAIWRAATATDFSRAVLEALATPDERARRMERSLTLVRRRHQRASVVADLERRFERLLEA